MGKPKKKCEQKFKVCNTPLIISSTKPKIQKKKINKGQIFNVSYYRKLTNEIVKSKVVLSRIWYYENKPYYLLINIVDYSITIVNEDFNFIPYYKLSNFQTEMYNVFRLIKLGYKNILHIP